MKKWKLPLLLLAAAGIVALLAIYVCRTDYPSPARRADKIILRYGDVNPEGNITTRTARYFAEQVRELSGGHMEIEVYASGVMGDEMQSYQQIQMGALDLYRANGGSLSKAGSHATNILALPFLFRDRDHLWNVLLGDAGREILADLAESGTQMVGLFYLDEGQRNLFMVNRPIHRVEELSGLRIRAMVSDILEDTFQALGAIPVESTYAELYNTLESGAVDGADNPVASYTSNKFYQVAPYYIRTGHMYPPSIVVMSEITWNHLSEADHAVLQEAAVRAMEFNRNEISMAEEKAYAFLRSQHVDIIEPEDPEAWKAAVEPVYAKYSSGLEELVERIREMK
ncbi:MAG: TRAP transporter substrate-binding protein [Clostridia bacterium]|nr:TRAP transporter substrate-binding protein [Clostridia bacterium]